MSIYTAAATAAGAIRHGVHLEIGELITYDPATHTGSFRLPGCIDNLTTPTESGDPIETGFIPIGTLYTGPGYGMRFVPKVDPQNGGSQCLILFSDKTLEHPLCAMFFFNDIETPPFTDIHTQGWQDEQGNQVTTNDSTGHVQLTGVEDAAIVAPETGLGDVFANLGPDNAVVTVGLLRTAVTAIFNSHVHTGVQTGTGDSGPPMTTMTPQGSATVRAKE